MRTPSDRAFLDMAIVSILSFQFHPANKKMDLKDDELIDEIDKTIAIAQIALHRRNLLTGE